MQRKDKTVAARSRRFRAKMKADDNTRLDLFIGNEVVAQLHDIAATLNIPLWQALARAVWLLAAEQGALGHSKDSADLPFG